MVIKFTTDESSKARSSSSLWMHENDGSWRALHENGKQAYNYDLRKNLTAITTDSPDHPDTLKTKGRLEHGVLG